MKDTGRISVDLSSAPKIASGNDSDVFRLGDKVYKDYRRLDLKRVARYVALVNRAVTELKSLKYHGTIKIRRTEYSIGAIGVPVDTFGIGPTSRPMSVSQYVPEPNLNRLLQPARMFRRGLEERLDYNASTLGFLMKLNEQLRTEDPTRVQDEFYYHLALLDRRLEQSLGATGLFIGKYNAKFRVIPERREITLVITDLAVYVDRVV